MNIVQSKKVVDGCEVSRRFTLYLSNFEYQSIYELMKLMLIPYPTDSAAVEFDLENKRVELMRTLPETIKKCLDNIIVECSKAL